MAVIRIGAPGVSLPTFPGLAAQTSGPNAGTIAGVTNALTLAAGETWNIPGGTWMITPGPYTFLQEIDPVTNVYRTRPTGTTNNFFVVSDGTNFRLANTTGCVVGAAITTSTCTGAVNGIGAAINGVTCTASSGASVWTTIVGGAIASVIATSTGVSTAGSGYTYPPIVIIDAPPQGGLQATAFCSLSGGSTITAAAITVTNQGAGYAAAPNITFVNDPRDTTGAGAVYVTTLTATGTLTGLYPINHGTPLTGVPALTFGIGSCAATAIMNFTVTGFTSGVTLGSSIGAATIMSSGHLVAAQGAGSIVNPMHATGIVFPRPARIQAVITTGTVIATGAVVEDAGLGIQAVPAPVLAYSITSTTAVVPQVATTLSVGGTTDTSLIQAM